MGVLYDFSGEFWEEIPSVMNEGEVLYALKSQKLDSSHIALIRDVSGFSAETVAEWLHVTPRTLRNYTKQNTVPDENIRERLLLLLGLFKHGASVFGSVQDFGTWLRSENIYFDNATPASMLGSVTGVRYVDQFLVAMEHGDNI